MPYPRRGRVCSSDVSREKEMQPRLLFGGKILKQNVSSRPVLRDCGSCTILSPVVTLQKGTCVGRGGTNGPRCRKKGSTNT